MSRIYQANDSLYPLKAGDKAGDSRSLRPKQFKINQGEK
jgi:hypothetical protein